MMKKEDILKQAIEFIEIKGVIGFSLNEFLSYYKISKGSFYHFFKDKDSLIFETLKNKMQSYRYKVESEIYKLKSLDSKLYKIFECYCVDTSQNRSVVRIYDELFSYTIKTNNPLFIHYFAEFRDCTHYLITQSIESSDLSRSKKSLALSLVPFLSSGIDGYWFLEGILERDNYPISKEGAKEHLDINKPPDLWSIQSKKIKEAITTLCTLLYTNKNSNLDSITKP